MDLMTGLREKQKKNTGNDPGDAAGAEQKRIYVSAGWYIYLQKY